MFPANLPILALERKRSDEIASGLITTSVILVVGFAAMMIYFSHQGVALERLQDVARFGAAVYVLYLLYGFGRGLISHYLTTKAMLQRETLSAYASDFSFILPLVTTVLNTGDEEATEQRDTAVAYLADLLKNKHGSDTVPSPTSGDKA